jgi:hypothetical protein
VKVIGLWLTLDFSSPAARTDSGNSGKPVARSHSCAHIEAETEGITQAEAEIRGEQVSNQSPQTTAGLETKPFPGTWMGTMQTFPAGNQTTLLAVDPTETTMTVTWFGKQTVAKAQLDGDTLRATFPPPPFQPQAHTWSLTPQPDGVNARVRFQCFLNDFMAVFHRSGAESGAAKTAR